MCTHIQYVYVLLIAAGLYIEYTPHHIQHSINHVQLVQIYAPLGHGLYTANVI